MEVNEPNLFSLYVNSINSPEIFPLSKQFCVSTVQRFSFITINTSLVIVNKRIAQTYSVIYLDIPSSVDVVWNVDISATFL